MEEKKNLRNETVHNIIIESRSRMSISGVEDVESFNEDKIVLVTQMGVLSVEGSNLHINKLSVDSGEMLIDGTIDGIVYLGDDDYGHKPGFFARLFQ